LEGIFLQINLNKNKLAIDSTRKINKAYLTKKWGAQHRNLLIEAKKNQLNRQMEKLPKQRKSRTLVEFSLVSFENEGG